MGWLVAGPKLFKDSSKGTEAMLVLSRKKMQGLKIIDNQTGNTIGEISILKIREGNVVRLGMDFDRRYAIIRDDAIKMDGPTAQPAPLAAR